MKSVLALLLVIAPCFGADYCTKTGEVCHLTKLSAKPSFVPVTISPEAYKEFRKAYLANDSEGMAQISEAGQLLGASVGGGIRILDQSVLSGWTEGRLTSGQYAGRHVWVTMNWVK